MNCAEVRALLDAFVDGELDGERAAATGRHLAVCPGCEADVAAIERTQSLLRSAVADRVESIDSGRVLAAVEAAIAHDERVGERPAAWRRGAAGRGAARVGRAGARALDDARLDPAGEWLASPRRGRRIAGPIASAGLLAAGLAAAVLLRPGGWPGTTPPDATVARVEVASPAAGVPAVAAVPAPPVRLAQAPGSGRLDVESVDFEGRSLAMWNEPESDTTIIWIDDDEPAAGGTR